MRRAHIIYVNGARKDDTALGRLMQDFACKNPDEMHYRVLADRTRYYKQSDKGEQSMCKIMDELKEEGRAEGREETLLDLATDMIAEGKLSYNEIARYTRLPEARVRELAETAAAAR